MQRVNMKCHERNQQWKRLGKISRNKTNAKVDLLRERGEERKRLGAAATRRPKHKSKKERSRENVRRNAEGKGLAKNRHR
jgi:hypothetical protein